MKTVLITGGTGLVGNRMTHFLTEKGYNVRYLSRKGDLNAEIPRYEWNIDKGTIEENAFDGVDHIIHLAGAGVADKRWTATRKKEIIDSRVDSTAILAKYLSQLTEKPTSIVSASAIGYYGDTGSNIVDESTGKGEGFLSETTEMWEKSVETMATLAGVPTAWVRVGIVMSMKGGAMEKMVLPFKFGIGNTLGSGDQYYSWIHIDDICKLFIFLMENNAQGPYNGVAPRPATNKEITKSIGRAMGRSLILPAPAFALKLALGEMADMVLLSNRCSAEKVLEAGYQFEYADLDVAMKDLVTRKV